jgi:hypothetical protein
MTELTAEGNAYIAAVSTLFGQLVVFAEEKTAQMHVGRRATGGWTVAVEWGEEIDGALEADGAHGIGEGIGEALAIVVKQCGLGEGDPSVVPTIPTDLAAAYVNGRNAGYAAAHAAAEKVMKSMARELAEARDLLKECQ